MRYLLFLALPLYALDQITKFLVIQNVPPLDSITVIPGFFNLVHVTNTGAAFGSFKGKGWFFIALSVVAVGVLSAMFLRGGFKDAWSRTAFALLIAGIFGNITDRLRFGHVIDFLEFHIRAIPLAIFNPWPSFNVADSCICVAVGCFLISSFLESRHKT